MKSGVICHLHFKTFKSVNTDILFLHKIFQFLVYNKFCYQVDTNLGPTPWTSSHPKVFCRNNCIITSSHLFLVRTTILQGIFKRLHPHLSQNTIKVLEMYICRRSFLGYSYPKHTTLPQKKNRNFL